MQTNFQWPHPAIGIRPTIDGRQMGVRESLEDQTMNMAKSLADLLTSELKYADGTPVRCVIADTTIGRVAEAAACAEKFKREDVGVVITVTPCWCYGSETIDMDPHTPKAIWASMALSVREPCIWLRLWQAIPKKDCPHLVFMEMT
ncbi:MAG TPA: hypothetical protein PKW69_06330 [Niabella sp.]|nr:hypothetical protein [Niabella sp.]